MKAPYKLWSLEDMLPFNAPRFNYVTTLLAGIETTLALLKWVKDTEGKGEINEKIDMAALTPDIDALTQQLKELGMDDCAIELVRTKNELIRYCGSTKAGDPFKMLDSFKRRLHDALKRPQFFMLSGAEVELYYPTKPLFGKEVNDKFPSIIFEINEAAKCLALERPTASIFHLMRMMEVTLKAVARCLQVQDPNNPNWGVWLNLIREKRIARHKAADNQWSENAFFQDVCQRLDAIKDASRNPTMHVETIYTPEEAKYIFDITKGFMTKIASRMDEKGEPFA